METMNQTVSLLSCKRKRVQSLHKDVSMLRSYSLVRIGHCQTSTSKMQRVDSYSSLVTEESTDFTIDSDFSASSNLSGLPQELILMIISYLGPQSNSLLKMAQVHKRLYHTMAQVGDALLLKAQANFRTLLPKLHPLESTLSLFIRHIRCYTDIQTKCLQLKRILAKDFVVGCCLGSIVIRSIKSGQDASSSEASFANVKNEVVSIEEVDAALDMSLELVGQDALSYFLSSGSLMIGDVDLNLLTSRRRNVIQHCSESMEHSILSLVGQCGGKVYKFMKMRHITRDALFSIGADAVDTADIEAPCDYADVDRMDRARLLMRLVICRDLQLAEQGQGRRNFPIGRGGALSPCNIYTPPVPINARYM